MAFLRQSIFKLIATIAVLFAFGSAPVSAGPASTPMPMQMTMPSDMSHGERDCHDRKAADTCALSPCGMLCQAVPPIVPAVSAPLRDQPTYWTSLRHQHSSELAPETPPPRGA